MKKRTYFIYKYIFPNGKVYIGQTYKGSGRYGTQFGYKGQLVYRAMKKYPNYEKEILEYCSLENVDERERYYIEKYKSMEKPFGYNREGGGNESKIRSKETKHLIASIRGGQSVVQYDLTGKAIKSWDYVSDAAEELEINADQIYRCCRNKAKSAGGFLWAFKKDNKNVLKKYNRNESHYKEVYQFDLSGAFIKKWNSLQDAEKELNILYSSISSCCNGKIKSAGGYIWSYKNECKPYKKKSIAKKVYQYSLSGLFIREWDTAQEAADYYNFNRKLINACCNKQQKSAHGYQWSYSKQEQLPMWISNEPMIRVIEQLSLQDELIDSFNSISEAARSLGVSVTSIQNCLKGRSKTAHGYKWKYK